MVKTSIDMWIMDIICENQSEKGKNLYSANKLFNELCQNEISALTTHGNEVDLALGWVGDLPSPNHQPNQVQNQPHFHSLFMEKSFSTLCLMIENVSIYSLNNISIVVVFHLQQ